jgi:hypothetical protein
MGSRLVDDAFVDDGAAGERRGRRHDRSGFLSADRVPDLLELVSDRCAAVPDPECSRVVQACQPGVLLERREQHGGWKQLGHPRWERPVVTQCCTAAGARTQMRCEQPFVVRRRFPVTRRRQKRPEALAVLPGLELREPVEEPLPSLAQRPVHLGPAVPGLRGDLVVGVADGLQEKALDLALFELSESLRASAYSLAFWRELLGTLGLVARRRAVE